jgi:hypothetical protein
LPQVDNKLPDTRTGFGLGQGVGHLHQNPVGGQEVRAQVTREGERAFVVLVVPVESGDKIECIGENGVHGRRWP